MDNKKKVMVLTSGGIDSTACIKYYQDLDFEVQGLFVDYGQPARKNELSSVQKISNYYKITYESIIVQHSAKISSGKISGRNGLLIMASILAKPGFQGLIALGIHAGSPYYDCSKNFVKKMDVLISEYSDGRIKLDFPFIDWDKKKIVSYCEDFHVPTFFTHSCENGDDPCGICRSCLDRKALNVR